MQKRYKRQISSKQTFFFGRCKLPPEIKEPFLEFRFGVSVSRKILYIYKIFLFRKHNKFFGVSISWSIRDFSCGGFFYFLSLELKSAAFFFRKYKKRFILRKYKKSFLLSKYKKAFFSENIRIFLILGSVDN